MKYDLGLEANGHLHNLWNGWYPHIELEFAIFALTPGIPSEWLRHFTYLRRSVYRRKVSYEIVKRHYAQAMPLAMENAASITLDDGYRMMELTNRARTYTGAIPHWASLAMAEDMSKLTEKELVKKWRKPIWRMKAWRKSSYHPLTLERIRPGRGGIMPRAYDGQSYDALRKAKAS